MKIADSQSIKTGEKEMILSIMKKMDPQGLAAIATQDLAPDSLEFVTGDMAIVDNRIVYKMNFKVTVDLAVMFDRDGNLVTAGGAGENETVPDRAGDVDSEDEDIIDLVEENDAETLRGVDSAMDTPGAVDADSLEQVLQKSKEFWMGRNDTAQV